MDEAYYLARMRASLAMAHDAAGSAARLIHLDLAGRYSVAAATSAADRPRVRCRSIRPDPTSFRINDNHPPAPVQSVAALCLVATG